MCWSRGGRPREVDLSLGPNQTLYEIMKAVIGTFSFAYLFQSIWVHLGDVETSILHGGQGSRPWIPGPGSSRDIPQTCCNTLHNPGWIARALRFLASSLALYLPWTSLSLCSTLLSLIKTNYRHRLLKKDSYSWKASLLIWGFRAL